MDDSLGLALTLWTARIAVLAYVARWWFELRARNWPGTNTARTAKWTWTLGCGFFLLHVVCAFAFVHDWSHAAAYRHVAATTAGAIGIDWGGGLFVNYAFTIIWVADVVMWWRRDSKDGWGSPIVSWSVHTLFALIVFAATVVFGPPLWRFVAVAVVIALAAAWRAGGRTIASR